MDFKNRIVAPGKSVYKLVTDTFSLISYPMFLAVSLFADKLSKINSHISLNKIWIISMMKGGGWEEWKLLCLAMGRIQPPPFLSHSTWSTFLPPDTHQY